MPRKPVPKEERKSNAGRKPQDFSPYVEMGDALIVWAKTSMPGSFFGDFILDTPYTRDQVEHAEASCPEFARKLDLAKKILARNWRNLGVERNSGFVRAMMPLVDRDYKEWRMQELRVTAAATADPKAALAELMNKSESPIKE